MDKIVDVAEVNQRHRLDESGQWLESVYRTHLVLASGKLVRKKSLLFMSFRDFFGKILLGCFFLAETNFFNFFLESVSPFFGAPADFGIHPYRLFPGFLAAELHFCPLALSLSLALALTR